MFKKQKITKELLALANKTPGEWVCIETTEQLKTNPGGKKFDEGKSEFDRLSFQALGEFNRVHQAGDKKYNEGNWREGLEIKRLINAAIRHLTQLLDGELVDSETKTLHSANAGVNCEMITHFLLNQELYRDYVKLPSRPKPRSSK